MCPVGAPVAVTGKTAAGNVSMKIVALNPPFLPRYSRESRSPAVAKSGTLYYPMWLAYAVGCLEKLGHEVLFIDAPAAGLSFEEAAKRIGEFSPRLAVVDTSTPSIYSDVEAACGLKKRIPGLFTVLVGVHVSALPEETLSLNPGIDAVAFGEYEATLAELAAAFDAPAGAGGLRSVAGLAFRDGNGGHRSQRPARVHRRPRRHAHGVRGV